MVFSPYWDTLSYNQHHLYFYHNFDKQTQDTESDSFESDQAHNKTFANACVDPWQHKCQFTHQLTSPEPENEIHREGPQVSLLQQLLRAL